VLPDDGSELPPPVNFAESDLTTRHETEQQDDGRILGRQRALSFHPTLKLAMQTLDHVNRPDFPGGSRS
jgi:hypothetical protein